jgi:hypothetical protein
MLKEQRRRVRVLFDEAHSEAWTISPQVAAQMQPHAPFDSSYAKAAQDLARRDFAAERHAEGPITPEVLAGAGVLVIAHPSEPRWERTTGNASPRFTPDEMAAIHDFVQAGGGLIVLGETEHAKYGNNLNDLLAPFGICIETATVWDYTHHEKVPSWVKVLPSANGIRSTGLLTQVHEACVYRAGVLCLSGSAKPLMLTSDVAQPAGAPVMAAAPFGKGRVVVAADSDWLGDEFFEAHQHAQLWRNMVYWVGENAFSNSPHPEPPPGGGKPLPQGERGVESWLQLKTAVNTLRQWQNADGSIDTARASLDDVAQQVNTMIESLAALQPRFPHLHDYHACVIADLRQWVEAGCGKPDFARSLAAFNPQALRQDGIEHLVVFPLYTPNGSSDTRFEALWVRVPWPAWLAQLERESYGNDKFVPLMMVDCSEGYDSECAVLFPETVSVGSKATNNFGGIFCDREAARYGRTLRKAAGALRFTLPPQLAALLHSPDLLRETYMLWDLIHDTSHSHGELPFDPFMIRQRLPYWMYSLEELRVDLWTFCESVALENAMPFAQNVQYALLLDRIIRFPITGSRVRNYDGLGGQLLFAFLHQRGIATWRDNQLEIDWDALPAGVAELRRQVDDLYRAGIDMTKVQYWVAAHDFVSQYVRPNLASQWARDSRVITDESQPKAWIDRVLNDEFPLSLFYQSLQKKMAA